MVNEILKLVSSHCVLTLKRKYCCLGINEIVFDILKVFKLHKLVLSFKH